MRCGLRFASNDAGQLIFRRLLRAPPDPCDTYASRRTSAPAIPTPARAALAPTIVTVPAAPITLARRVLPMNLDDVRINDARHWAHAEGRCLGER